MLSVFILYTRMRKSLRLFSGHPIGIMQYVGHANQQRQCYGQHLNYEGNQRNELISVATGAGSGAAEKHHLL